MANNAKTLTLRHDFSPKDVPVSTTCIICSGMMLGFGKQAYQCNRCGQAVHKKCLRKGLDDLCSQDSDLQMPGVPSLSEEEVRNLQQSVFALQKSLFQQQILLDNKIKEFEKEKERFEVCKSWIAKLLPEGLQEYFDSIDDIVKAQRSTREWIKAKRSDDFKKKRRDFGDSVKLNANATRWYTLVQEYRHSIAAEDARKRYHSYLEILTTERQYNISLKALRSYFVTPLREEAVYAKRPIITNEEMEELLILQSLETISAIQEELLSELEACYRSDNFDRFGEVFLKFIPRFSSPYLRYLIGYDASSALFTKLQTSNREFCILLKRCETSVPGATFGTSLNLQSYLVQPCQRLPRYQMLFQALLKQSPQDHKDFHHLQEVTEQITKVVIFINDRKAEYEDRQTLSSLQQSILDYGIVKPGRRILKHGALVGFDLSPLADGEKSDREKCYGILCNDIMIITARNRRKLHSVRLVVPSAVIERATEASADEVWAQDQDGEQTGFRLALTDSTTFRFVPPDIQEMKNWVRLLAGVKATVQQEASMDGKLLGDIPGDILKHDYSLSIKVKQINPITMPAKSRQRETGIIAIALYESAMREGSKPLLEFKPGDLIVNIEPREGKGWWIGQVFGSSVRSPFPRSYVSVLPSYATILGLAPLTPGSASTIQTSSTFCVSSTRAPNVPLPSATFSNSDGPKLPVRPRSGSNARDRGPAPLPPAIQGQQQQQQSPRQSPSRAPPLPSRQGQQQSPRQSPRQSPSPRRGTNPPLPGLPVRGDALSLDERPGVPDPAPSPRSASVLAAVGGGRKGARPFSQFEKGSKYSSPIDKGALSSKWDQFRNNPTIERKGYCLQVVYKTQSFCCPPKVTDGGKIVWNESFNFSGVTPQGQAIIVLFDTVTNAVVGYDKLLLRNLKFNRMNPFQMRLSASAGVLELDVDIKPIGQTEERLTHGFESQIQTFSLYCPACLRAIQPHAPAQHCKTCGLVVHNECKPKIEEDCIPLIQTQTSEKTPTSTSVESLSRLAPKEKMDTFDALMNGLALSKDNLFRPTIASGLLRRVEVPLADFEVAMHTALKQEEQKGCHSMTKMVKVPKKGNLQDWLAANMIQFYKAVNQIYLLVAHECTDKSCPEMAASPTILYKWADGVKVIKAIDVTAPQYVKYLNEWIEWQFNDPKIFPPSGKWHKKTLLTNIKIMAKKLLRIIGHVYYQHFSTARLRAEEAFKLAFTYVYDFQQEYKLLDKKADATTLAPLDNLIRQIG